ncbi:MFS transporter [Nocardia rhamnosiphila]
MSLQLPPWLPPAVLEVVVGHFPEAREDAMRREADHLSETAEKCRARAQYFDDKADSRSAVLGGAGGDQLGKQCRDTADSCRHQADRLDSQAEQLYEGANAFEVQKWTVIGFALILAWTLLHAAIMFAYGGALEGYVATMRTRTALGIASRKLLEYLAGMSARAAAERGVVALSVKAAGLGAVQGGGINLAVQLKQVAYEQRGEVAWKDEVLIAAVAGGVGGAAGAVAGKWVGDRWVIPATLARAELADTTGKRVMVQIGGAVLTGGAGGLVGGLFGTGVAVGMSGEGWTLDAFTESLLPAVAGGFLGAAGHSLASLRAAAPPVVAGPDADITPGLGAPRGTDARPPVSGSDARPLTDALDAYGPLPAADANTRPKTHQQKLDELLSGLLREAGARERNSVEWQPKNLVLPDNVNSAKTDTLAAHAESAPVPSRRQADAGAGPDRSAHPAPGAEPSPTDRDSGRTAQPAGDSHARLFQRLHGDESPGRHPGKPADLLSGSVDELSGGRVNIAEGSVGKPDKPTGPLAAEVNRSTGNDIRGFSLRPDSGPERPPAAGDDAVVAAIRSAESREGTDTTGKPETAAARPSTGGDDAVAAAVKSAESPEGTGRIRQGEFDGVVVPEPVGAPAKVSAAAAEPPARSRISPDALPARAADDTKPPPNKAEPSGRPHAYPDKPVSADASGTPPEPPVMRPEPKSSEVPGVNAKSAEDAAPVRTAARDEPGRTAEESGTSKPDTDSAGPPRSEDSETAGGRDGSDPGSSVAGPESAPDGAELAARYRDEADAVLARHAATDWSLVSPEGLEWMVRHGDAREAATAMVEMIRRGDPKHRVLRWTQVMAVLVARDGGVGNMQAGEGKTLVFLAAAGLKAAQGGPVKIITTRDVLANEAFGEYRTILGEHGFDIVRMNPDNPYAEPGDGRPTIYIGTMNDAGFGELRGHVAPARRNGIDEIDEALVHADTTFILSEGAGNPAGDEVVAAVADAHAFLTDARRAGLLSEFDFGREPGRVGGGTALTDGGRVKIEDVLGRPLTDEEAHRLTMAATAEWEYAENDHYVVWHHPELGPEHVTTADGAQVLNPDAHKIYIIDQTSHKVMFDAETSTESRWNGGLAQAAEAKHGIRIRDDPAGSASITAGEMFSAAKSDELFGFSGTADGVANELQNNHGVKHVVDIPRFTPSQLKIADDYVAVGREGIISHQDAKLLAMAHSIAERQPGGNPQLAICNRNSEVGRLSTMLDDLGVDHIAVDAKFFLRHGAHAEAELQKIFHAAGERGKVLVINRQGGRGVDIPVAPDIDADGGLHVLISGRSAESRAVDIQAENRTARSGGNGSAQYFTAPDDALYAQTPEAQVSIIRYTQHQEALAEHRAVLAEHAAGPTPETQEKLRQSTNKLALTERNLAAANDNVRALAEKLQPIGVRTAGIHDPATAHLSNSPPATETPAARSVNPELPRQPPPIRIAGDGATLDPAGSTPPLIAALSNATQPQPYSPETSSIGQSPRTDNADAAAGKVPDDSIAAEVGRSEDLAEVPAGHPAELRAARSGDADAAGSLVQKYWPAALTQAATQLGWDTMSGAPTGTVRQLAHAMAFAGFRAAASDGWSVPAGQDLLDWLRGKTGDALLDGLGQLGLAERNLVAGVLQAPPRGQQPTEDQVGALEQLTRAIHAQYRAGDVSESVGVPPGSATDATGTAARSMAADLAGIAGRAADPSASAGDPAAGRPDTAPMPSNLTVATSDSAMAPRMDPNTEADLRALQRGVVTAYRILEGDAISEPVVAALAAAPVALFGRFVDQLYPSQRTALELRFRQGLTEAQTAYVHNARTATGQDWNAITVGTLAAGGLRRLARAIAADHGIPGIGASLTAAELTVLQLSSQGLSRAVIAERSTMPRRAAVAAGRDAARKLGVTNRAASVAEATRRGDLDPTAFPAPPGAAAVRLSERETAVLTLTAKGLVPESVAAALSLRPAEVHDHLADMGRALGTHIPAGMVAVGIRAGILEVNGSSWSRWEVSDSGTVAPETPAVVGAADSAGRPMPVDPAALTGRPIDGSTLARAQAGHKSAAQELNGRYGRGNIARTVAMLGWDPARGTPPTQLARLVHAIHFRVVAAADTDHWPVPAGQGVGDWLFEAAQNALLDCLDQVNVHDRRTIGAAIEGLHRGADPTEEQLAAIQRLATVAQRPSRRIEAERSGAGIPAADSAHTGSAKPSVGVDGGYREPGVAAPVGGFDPALVTAINPDVPIGSHTVIGRGKPAPQSGGEAVAVAPAAESGPDGGTAEPVAAERLVLYSRLRPLFDRAQAELGRLAAVDPSLRAAVTVSPDESPEDAIRRFEGALTVAGHTDTTASRIAGFRRAVENYLATYRQIAQRDVTATRDMRAALRRAARRDHDADTVHRAAVAQRTDCVGRVALLVNDYYRATADVSRAMAVPEDTLDDGAPGPVLSWLARGHFEDFGDGGAGLQAIARNLADRGWGAGMIIEEVYADGRSGHALFAVNDHGTVRLFDPDQPDIAPVRLHPDRITVSGDVAYYRGIELDPSGRAANRIRTEPEERDTGGSIVRRGAPATLYGSDPSARRPDPGNAQGKPGPAPAADPRPVVTSTGEHRDGTSPEGEAEPSTSVLDLETADVASLQRAMAEGRTNSVALVEEYLRRIEALDRAGPRLNAVRALNPDALRDAARLDAERAEGRVRGPLHGIPVLIKDNIDAAGMPTTAGALALRDSRPAQDAFLVARLREAGAVILGKTNLTEFANFITEGMPHGYSSLGGQVVNPYDPGLTPYGSSSGSAVAAAAGLAAVTVGTETFGSIISPSGFNSLVGVKPTVGLVSRTGIVPTSVTQDSAGPLARTVSDAAILLTVLAGVDAEDPATEAGAVVAGTDYLAGLSVDALRGKRLGIVTTAAEDLLDVASPADMLSRFSQAQAVLRAQGATLVPVAVVAPGGEGILSEEFKPALESYFARLPADAPVRTLDELIRFNIEHADEGTIRYGQSQFTKAAAIDLSDPDVYAKYVARRDQLGSAYRAVIDSALTANGLDALVFPHINSHLVAPRARYPAVSLPIGYDAVNSQPYSMTLVGTAFSEASLLAMAYAYEQSAPPRCSPSELNPEFAAAAATTRPPASNAPVELTEAEVTIVRLVAASDGSPARSLGALLGLPTEQANRLLIRLYSKLEGATDVRATSTAADRSPEGRRLTPTQIEILGLLAENMPGRGPAAATALTPGLLQAFRAQVENRPGAALGRTEREVLRLFMRGHSAKSAAARLNRHPRTVGRHFARAAQELHTRGVIPTVLAAVRAGLLADDSGPQEVVEFSEIETRALRAVAEGRTNEAIRAELGLGERRRRRLMTELYEKCAVDSKLGLALEAQRRGLLDDTATSPARRPDARAPGPEAAGRSAPVTPGNAPAHDLETGRAELSERLRPADAEERGWRQRRAQDEVELARALYHRPESRQAAVAMLDRLRAVLTALHPQATPEQIDNAFYATANTTASGMVLRSVPLDELRRDGNLRELMSAVLNAMIRSRELREPSGTTLDEGLARLLNQRGWEERADRLGLNVAALSRLRESITGGDPDKVIRAQDVRDEHNAVSDPGYIPVSEELTRSYADRKNRAGPDQQRRSLTVQDWNLLGMPLSLRELEAIPGDLVVLRKSRLDPDRPLRYDDRGRVDVETLESELAAEDDTFRYVLPLYRYDESGRRLRDETGNAQMSGILVYHQEGVVDAATALRLDPDQYAVPLPWRPGVARVDFRTDGEWFRRTAVERGFPVAAGLSGTAARLAFRFQVLAGAGIPEIAGISETDAAGAIMAFVLPQHHSLYETVSGLHMVGMPVVDESAVLAPEGTSADLYRAVFERFGLPVPGVPATTTESPQNLADRNLGHRSAGSPDSTSDSTTPTAANDPQRRDRSVRPAVLPGFMGVPDPEDPFGERGNPLDHGIVLPSRGNKRVGRLAQPHADGGGFPRAVRKTEISKPSEEASPQKPTGRPHSGPPAGDPAPAAADEPRGDEPVAAPASRDGNRARPPAAPAEVRGLLGPLARRFRFSKRGRVRFLGGGMVRAEAEAFEAQFTALWPQFEAVGAQDWYTHTLDRVHRNTETAPLTRYANRYGLVPERDDEGEALHPDEGINGRVAADGTLSFEIYGSERTPPGRTMFDDLWNAVGGEVTRIGATWRAGTGLTDNLDTFNRGITDGLSISEAALATWTGKMAARRGFTEVIVIALNGPEGAYDDVRLMFVEEGRSDRHTAVVRDDVARTDPVVAPEVGTGEAGRPAAEEEIAAGSPVGEADVPRIPRARVVGLAHLLREHAAGAEAGVATSGTDGIRPADILHAELALYHVSEAVRSGLDISGEALLEHVGGRVHDGWLQRNWRTAAPEHRLPYTDPAFPEQRRELIRGIVRTARDFVGTLDTGTPVSFDECATAAEVAAELHRRQFVEVVGFDLPGLAVETAREYARAIDELLTKYPHVQLHRVGFGPTGGGRMFAKVDNVPGDTASYPYTQSLMLSESIVTAPDMVRSAWSSMVAAGKAVGRADRPIAGLLLREFGDVLDNAGRQVAWDRAKGAALDVHKGLPFQDMIEARRADFRGYGLGRDGEFDPLSAITGAFAAGEQEPATMSRGEKVLYELVTREAENAVARYHERWRLTAEYRAVGPAEQQQKLALLAAAEADHGFRLIGADNPGIDLDTTQQIVDAVRYMTDAFQVLEVSDLRVEEQSAGTFAQAGPSGITFNELWVTAPQLMRAEAARAKSLGTKRGDPERPYYTTGVHELTHVLRRTLTGVSSDILTVLREYFTDRYGPHDDPQFYDWVRAQFCEYGFEKNRAFRSGSAESVEQKWKIDPEEVEAEAVVATDVEVPGSTPTEGERVVRAHFAALDEAEARRRGLPPQARPAATTTSAAEPATVTTPWGAPRGQRGDDVARTDVAARPPAPSPWGNRPNTAKPATSGGHRATRPAATGSARPGAPSPDRRVVEMDEVLDIPRRRRSVPVPWVPQPGRGVPDQALAFHHGDRHGHGADHSDEGSGTERDGYERAEQDAGGTPETAPATGPGAAGETPPSSLEIVSARELFVTNKPYRRLFISNGVTGLGDSIQQSALPLMVLQETGSPLAAGGITFATFLPKILFEVPAGYLADFSDRLKMMWIAQSVGALGAAVAGAAVLFDAPNLASVLTATTLTEVTATIAYQRALGSSVLDLVTPAQRPRANRVSAVEGYLAGTGGRALGPVLLSVHKALPVGVNLLSYGWNLGLLPGMREHFPKPAPSDHTFKDVARELKAGGRAVWRDSFLRPYTGTIVFTNAAVAALNLRAATVVDAAALPGWTAGPVLAAGALGAVAGGFLPSRLIDKTKVENLFLAGLGGFTLAATTQAVTSNPFVVAAGTFGFGMVGVAMNSRVLGHQQEFIPRELFGRAVSVGNAVTGAGSATGALLGGAVLSAHGIDIAGWMPTAVVGAAAGGMAVRSLIKRWRSMFGFAWLRAAARDAWTIEAPAAPGIHSARPATTGPAPVGESRVRTVHLGRVSESGDLVARTGHTDSDRIESSFDTAAALRLRTTEHTLWASTDGLAYRLYWDSGRFSPLAGRSAADTNSLSHADSSATTAAEGSIPAAEEAPRWKDRADAGVPNIGDRVLAMGRIVPELGEEVGDLVAKSATLTARIAELRAAGWTMEYGVEGAGSYADRDRRKITVDGRYRHPYFADKTTATIAEEVALAAFDSPVWNAGHQGGPVEVWLEGLVVERLRAESEAKLFAVECMWEVERAGGPYIPAGGKYFSNYEAIYERFAEGAITRDEARDRVARMRDWTDIGQETTQSFGDYWRTHYTRRHPEAAPTAAQLTEIAYHVLVAHNTAGEERPSAADRDSGPAPAPEGRASDGGADYPAP